MIVVFGHRLYGAVDRCADTHVATRFFHIYWLPLIPLGSQLVLAQADDGSYRGLPAGLNLRSVLAAYARTWGALAAIAAWVGFATALGDDSPEADAAGAVLALLCALAATAVVVASWAWLGRLSADARGQRFVYSHYTGTSADVAAIAGDMPSLRAQLHATLVDRGRGLAATGGYRTALDPATEWRTIALDPSVTDAMYLGAALTLTRFEWASASDPRARGEYAQAHAQIWSKIQASHPNLLAAAAA